MLFRHPLAGTSTLPFPSYLPRHLDPRGISLPPPHLFFLFRLEPGPPSFPFLSYVLGWNRPCLWFLFPFPLGRCERVPRIHTDEERESGMGPRSPTNHPGTRSDGPRPGPRVRRGERRTVKRGRLFSTDGVRRTRECRVPSPSDRNRVRTRGILLSNPVVPGQRPSNRPSEEPPSPLHPSRTTLHTPSLPRSPTTPTRVCLQKRVDLLLPSLPDGQGRRICTRKREIEPFGKRNGCKRGGIRTTGRHSTCCRRQEATHRATASHPRPRLRPREARRSGSTQRVWPSAAVSKQGRKCGAKVGRTQDRIRLEKLEFERP